MTEQTQLTTTQQHDAPIEWGTREEIGALADRLRTLMPGKLTQAEALTLAQYSAAVDANPFRGEVYAYTDPQGKMILVEGYKILVRWARRQCQFYERYERITNETDTIPQDAIAFRCRILRQDAVADLARLTEAGIPDAYLILTTEAVGVVTKQETWSSKHNKPIAPPKGWTWEDVARKRALKNALNRAYGAPSPKEIAHETWMVDDVETTPEDWIQVTIPDEAKFNAQRRLRAPMDESATESIALLFGDEPGEPPEVPRDIIDQQDERDTIKAPSNAAETTVGVPGNGLDNLLEDVNAILLSKALNTYGHVNHLKNALKMLGYTSYKPALHEEMIEKLVERKLPPPLESHSEQGNGDAINGEDNDDLPF